MKPRDFDGGRRFLGIGIAGAVVALIALYSLYVALPFLLGPSLTLRTETTESGLTRVSGETARVAYLAINDAEVPLNEDGAFLISRAYPAGYTWLKAEARDRFGRTITKTLTFVSQ